MVSVGFCGKGGGKEEGGWNQGLGNGSIPVNKDTCAHPSIIIPTVSEGCSGIVHICGGNYVLCMYMYVRMYKPLVHDNTCA